MPSRILREGILDSDRVNSLSWDCEVFYRRLMSVVDDFGRFDGRTSILKARLYALKPSTRETDISRWIAQCVEAGLIALYQVEQKPYILYLNLGEPRAKFSKYPPPPANICTHMKTSACVCIQMRADVNGCLQTQADVPPSYSISNSTTTIEKNPPDPPLGNLATSGEIPGAAEGADKAAPPRSGIATTGQDAQKSTRKRPAREIDDSPWEESVCPLPHKDGAFLKAWDEWVAMRLSKKVPVTNRAARLTFEKIRKAGLTLSEATDCFLESAANGWQGVFPDKIIDRRSVQGVKTSGFATKRDQEMREMAENAEIIRQTEIELANRKQHGQQLAIPASQPVFEFGTEPVAFGPG